MAQWHSDPAAQWPMEGLFKDTHAFMLIAGIRNRKYNRQTN
jgi:hypothetical protein